MTSKIFAILFLLLLISCPILGQISTSTRRRAATRTRPGVSGPTGNGAQGPGSSGQNTS